MSWIGDAAEQGAGFAGGIVGGVLAAKRAKAARAWSKRRYAERYQVTMKDMKKAGLNPMLAAGMGLGGGGAPQAQGAGQEALGPTVNAAREGTTKRRSQKNQASLWTAQESAFRSQATLNVAQAASARATALKTIAETKVVGWKQPMATVGKDVAGVYEGIKGTNWENVARNAYLNSIGSLKQLREVNRRFYEKKKQPNWNPQGFDLRAKNQRNQ